MQTRLSRIFNGMKVRCYNPNHGDYKRYGLRGITVCDEWYTPHSHAGFNAFKKWALSHGYRDDLTIDRIDYNKGYSPENCRWVDMGVQNNNSSHNHLITYNNKTQSLSLWCREFSLPYDTIKRRINCFGWSAEKAFNTPIRVLHKRST